ncbi:MAG: hypothetical protein DSZ32_01635 [Gammaproteobacteria bacterium]|nr:MAG: hypothetical protein DSZ32_01635 [Gammaproteobacteria bacterium]
MNNLPIELTAPIIVPRDHPSLADHFPSRPVAPGALVLDLMISAYLARFPQKKLVEIVVAKFLQPVAPAVVYTLTVSKGKNGSLVFKLLDANNHLLLTAAMRFEPR